MSESAGRTSAASRRFHPCACVEAFQLGTSRRRSRKRDASSAGDRIRRSWEVDPRGASLRASGTSSHRSRHTVLERGLGAHAGERMGGSCSRASVPGSVGDGRQLRRNARHAACCPERLSWEFVVWVWSYPSRRRPEILAKLERCVAKRRSLSSRRAARCRRFSRAWCPSILRTRAL